MHRECLVIAEIRVDYHKETAAAGMMRVFKDDSLIKPPDVFKETMK